MAATISSKDMPRPAFSRSFLSRSHRNGFTKASYQHVCLLSSPLYHHDYVSTDPANRRALLLRATVLSGGLERYFSGHDLASGLELPSL